MFVCMCICVKQKVLEANLIIYKSLGLVLLTLFASFFRNQTYSLCGQMYLRLLLAIELEKLIFSMYI